MFIAILPSGRVAWLRIAPAPAPAEEVNHLLQAVERGQLRRQSGIRSLDEAVGRLSRSVSADVARVSSARQRAHRERRRQLLKGDARLDRRISTRFARRRSALAKQGDRAWGLARRLGRRSLWDELVIASSFPLFAAFGQRGNPLAENNLTLVLLLLVWLVGDELTDLVSGAKRESPDVRDTDVWSYVAPFGNLLTGWLLMRNEQHERFVAGFADSLELTGPPAPGALLGGGLRERFYTYAQTIDLAPFLAPDHVADFQTFGDVPAVASVTSVLPASHLGSAAGAHVRAVAAAVDRGGLTITVTAVAIEPDAAPPQSILASLSVAWIVDTEERSWNGQ